MKKGREFNILDILLMNILKKYTCKIYRRGIRDGFNWEKQKMTTFCPRKLNFDK